MIRVCIICFLLVISLLFFGAATSAAAEAAGESGIPKKVLKLDDRFKVAEKKLIEPLLRLDQNYGKHLENLLKEKQRSGDLQGVLKVKQEIKRVRAAEIDVSEVKDLELNRSRKTYFKARQNALKLAAPQRIRLLKIYKSQLRELTASLTKAGKIEEALKVQAYTVEVEGDLLAQEKLALGSGFLKYGQPDWDFIEGSVKRGNLEKVTAGEVVQENFYDIGEQPRVLVGFRLALNNFGGYRIVRGLQAVFRGRDGKDVISKIPVGTKKPIEHRKVVAKKGYAVGAVEYEMAPFVRRVRVQFYRIVGTKLDAEDNYFSAWYGKWEGPSTRERVEAGKKIAVGIHGKYGLGLDKVGLVLINSAAQ